MTDLTTIHLREPYLILIGGEPDPTFAKTGLGLVQWCPEKVAGQFRFPGGGVDLGVPDLTLEEAVAAGAGSLVIGVAPVGGAIPESWWQVIEQAARAGLDIVSGMHLRLAERDGLADAAKAGGARLIDVRVPPAGIPVGNGKPRGGRRLLTVGTDCVVGKKYTALALTRALQEAGMNATFRATGQTGILIAGEGIAVDAVVSDFVSGAAERISPANDDDHWDVIEGQGSLFHPGYSGVALGLLHGSQPDAFVLCHDAARTAHSGWEHYPLPTFEECIEQHLAMGRRTSPGIRCVGLSINTSSLDRDARATYLADLRERTGLPCVDPLRDGCGPLVERIQTEFPE